MTNEQLREPERRIRRKLKSARNVAARLRWTFFFSAKKMRMFTTEGRLPPRMSYFNVRSILVVLALVSIVASHAMARGYVAIELCAVVSWMVAIGLAAGCAYTTAHTTRVRIGKFVFSAIVATGFVAFVSAIFLLRQGDVDFHESGQWAPLPPEVLSVPIQVLCGFGALAAAWGLLYLVSVVESLEESEPHQVIAQQVDARER